MRFPRSGGVLLHPTSFPSRYGMGDFGPEARIFIDFLKETDQTIWQVLPLSPVGYGNSPYTAYSAFAGNPYLISPDILLEKGLLKHEELEGSRIPVITTINYEHAYEIKNKHLKAASTRFYEEADIESGNKLEEFITGNQNWLEDYVIFSVLSKHQNRKAWNKWDSELAQKKPAAIRKIRKEFQAEIRHEIWLQFEFFQQWMDLKKYANERDIRIIGDIPIFVDHNSADIWANPEYFAVDKKGNRELVAGVPPDYFSETGQLWGNPLYNWKKLKKDGYQWWIDRFSQMFQLYDAIRVDHFRGFESYWQVSASEKTAIKGNWVKAPGKELFTTIGNALGRLPIIAEDLGFITPEVEELRDEFLFPGMKILHFAFDGDPDNDFLPHNYEQNCVVYSGTHDNDTSIGWFHSAPESEKHHMRNYTRSDGREPNWELIRLAMFSVADQAIFPMQDYMNLGNEHRMNLPGTVGKNWKWRYTDEMLHQVNKNRVKQLIYESNRNPGKPN
jgi:4-alpha-glucanotransferase